MMVGVGVWVVVFAGVVNSQFRNSPRSRKTSNVLYIVVNETVG